MKPLKRKRTPRVKIDETELTHFAKVGAPDPYWNDLYNPKAVYVAPRPQYLMAT